MTIMVKVMAWSFPFYLKLSKKAGWYPDLHRSQCKTVIFFDPSVLQLKAKATPSVIKEWRMDLLLLLRLEYQKEGLIHLPVYH